MYKLTIPDGTALAVLDAWDRHRYLVPGPRCVAGTFHLVDGEWWLKATDAAHNLFTVRHQHLPEGWVTYCGWRDPRGLCEPMVLPDQRSTPSSRRSQFARAA